MSEKSGVAQVQSTGAVASAIEKTLIQGDLAALSPEQRISYYKAVCDSVGLNPLTKPFDYIPLNGKLVLYAKRDATDQLRKVHGVSIEITNRARVDDVYIVTARAKMPSGREDESTGAVYIGATKGEALANLFMKAETKAKRRATLSICGLGLLDETEVETIPHAQKTSGPTFVKAPLAVVNESEPSEELTGTDLDLAEYVIPFGKMLGKRLGDVDEDTIQSYVAWLKTTSQKDGKPLSAKAQEFIMAANTYLDHLQEKEMGRIKL